MFWCEKMAKSIRSIEVRFWKVPMVRVRRRTSRKRRGVGGSHKLSFFGRGVSGEAASAAMIIGPFQPDFS